MNFFSIFEKISSSVSHFWEDKSCEAWSKNNAETPQYMGVALLWDRHKSHCPWSFQIVGINSSEEFVCSFVQYSTMISFCIFRNLTAFIIKTELKIQLLRSYNLPLFNTSVWVCLNSLHGAQSSCFPEGEWQACAWNNKNWLWKFATYMLIIFIFLHRPENLKGASRIPYPVTGCETTSTL